MISSSNSLKTDINDDTDKPAHTPDNPEPGSGAALVPRSFFADLFYSLPLFGVFNRRKKGSVVDRILWLLVAWGLLIYVLAIIGIWWGSSYVIEDSFENQAIEWVGKLDELGTPLYASEDERLFGSIEDHVKRFPELAYLRYYDAEDNRVIAQYIASQFHEAAIPPLSKVHFSTLRQSLGSDNPVMINTFPGRLSLMRAAAPIMIRSIESDGFMEYYLDNTEAGAEHYKVIGFIELGLDFGSYREQLLRNILYGSSVIAVIFLIATFIGHRIIKRALGPLTNLQEPLQKLAEGDIDVQVKGTGDHEIDAISNALNTTIAALKDRDQKLQQLANCDALTGLLNKQNFHLQLAKELKRVADEGDSSALIFIDLDKFKMINDTLGHAAGDRLLAQVADLLLNRTREKDVLARFGGDEFVVIVKSVTRDKARAVAESIVGGMQEFVFVDNDMPFNICCSLGVAIIDSSTSSVEEVFEEADMACLEAKSNGRNRYQVYDEATLIQTAGEIGASWSKNIGDALENDLFLLNYQPIVAMTGSSFEMYEVHLQMKQPNGHVINSRELLAAADRLGLSQDIGDWMLTNTLKKHNSISAEGRTIKLLINLSSHHFEMENLRDKVNAALQTYQVEPSCIIFQITEQTAIKQIEQTKYRMQALLDIGCQFALSEFGTGSNSFSYLKSIPVDYLKIDANFLSSAMADPIERVIVESTIKIARALGKQTIGDFVHNTNTIAALKKYEVDFAQGPYLSKPVASPHVAIYKMLVERVTAMPTG